jgi:hypothetical protein
LAAENKTTRACAGNAARQQCRPQGIIAKVTVVLRKDSFHHMSVLCATFIKFSSVDEEACLGRSPLFPIFGLRSLFLGKNRLFW